MNSKSINRKIFDSIMIISFLTLFVRLVSIAKEVYIVNIYGIGELLDIFITALIIPIFVISVFAGPIYGSLIPKLTEIRKREGRLQASALFANIFTIFTLIVLILSVIIGVLNSHILELISPNFIGSKFAETVSSSFKLIPLIIIGSLSILGGAVLNSEKLFFLPSIAPISTPLLLLLLLFVFSSLDKDLDVELLIIGMVGGYAIELLIILIGLNKLGYVCLPDFSKNYNNTKAIIKQYMPLLYAALLMSGTLFADQIMASWLSSGSVSALNYGIKIPAFFIGLASVGIGYSIIPHMSDQLYDKKYIEIRKTLLLYSVSIITISIPIVIVILFYSDLLVISLFERGAFTRDDSLLVSEVMRYSLLQSPFYILVVLYSKFISAINRNSVFIFLSIFILLLNVIVNLILMNIMGVAGIALSTSIVYMVGSFILFLIAIKEVNLLINVILRKNQTI